MLFFHAEVEESLPYVYFALFDGHAGSDVAVAASNRLHRILNEKLQSISDLLIAFGIEESPPWEESDPDSTSPREERGSIFVPKFSSDAMFSIHDPVKDKTITVDNLITGALEKAFWEMVSFRSKRSHMFQNHYRFFSRIKRLNEIKSITT